jgi:hypothetical protein
MIIVDTHVVIWLAFDQRLAQAAEHGHRVESVKNLMGLVNGRSVTLAAMD